MRGFSLLELRRLAGKGDMVGENSLLVRVSGIPTFRELRAVLDGELRRSRRYERPLTGLVVVPDIVPLHLAARKGSSVPSYVPDAGGLFTTGNGGDPGTNGHSPADGAGHPLNDTTAQVVPGWAMYSVQLKFLLLGSLLRGALRESDVVSYAAEHHEFFALLPECDVAAARQAVERFHRMYVGRTGTGVRAGVAAYPANGLTLDALVEHARHNLLEEPIRPAMPFTGASEVAYG